MSPTDRLREQADRARKELDRDVLTTILLSDLDALLDVVETGIKLRERVREIDAKEHDFGRLNEAAAFDDALREFALQEQTQ